MQHSRLIRISSDTGFARMKLILKNAVMRAKFSWSLSCRRLRRISRSECYTGEGETGAGIKTRRGNLGVEEKTAPFLPSPLPLRIFSSGPSFLPSPLPLRRFSSGPSFLPSPLPLRRFSSGPSFLSAPRSATGSPWVFLPRNLLFLQATLSSYD